MVLWTNSGYDRAPDPDRSPDPLRAGLEDFPLLIRLRMAMEVLNSKQSPP